MSWVFLAPAPSTAKSHPFELTGRFPLLATSSGERPAAPPLPGCEIVADDDDVQRELGGLLEFTRATVSGTYRRLARRVGELPVNSAFVRNFVQVWARLDLIQERAVGSSRRGCGH